MVRSAWTYFSAHSSMSSRAGLPAQTTTGDSQKEWERDIALDYTIQSGALKGVGFGWRNGKSNSEASRDQDQNRLIVSYSFALLYHRDT
jgi:hypothetical protein